VDLRSQTLRAVAASSGVLINDKIVKIQQDYESESSVFAKQREEEGDLESRNESLDNVSSVLSFEGSEFRSGSASPSEPNCLEGVEIDSCLTSNVMQSFSTSSFLSGCVLDSVKSCREAFHSNQSDSSNSSVRSRLPIFQRLSFDEARTS
jgi:hypothetical protein